MMTPSAVDFTTLLLALASALCLSAVATALAATYLNWGDDGAPGKLRYPYGVAVDAHRHVYVVDTGKNRIVKFTSGGAFLKSWRRIGPRAHFNSPRGVAVDARRHVYALDSSNGRVEKFTSGGHLLRSWGREGAGPGEFATPEGIAVTPNGYVFVADTYRSRIQKFSPGGEFLRRWGSDGNGLGQFRHPRGVAIDATTMSTSQNRATIESRSSAPAAISWTAGGARDRVRASSSFRLASRLTPPATCSSANAAATVGSKSSARPASS